MAAPSDPTRDALLEDLRRLRRMSGPLTADRLAQLDNLTGYLGSGSGEQAFTALMSLRRRHGQDVEADIGAYFFTAGWKVGRDTLDQRLSHYAKRYHVNERTALRRSNRGAFRLATLIRETLRYDRPWIRLFAFQTAAVMKSSLYVELDEGEDWRRPRVYICGQRIENLEFGLKVTETLSYRIGCIVQLPDQQLDVNVNGLDALASIHVVWAMPVWPSWDVTAHLADNRLFEHLNVERAGTATIHIKWISVGAAETRETPLLKAPSWE